MWVNCFCDLLWSSQRSPPHATPFIIWIHWVNKGQGTFLVSAITIIMAMESRFIIIELFVKPAKPSPTGATFTLSQTLLNVCCLESETLHTNCMKESSAVENTKHLTHKCNERYVRDRRWKLLKMIVKKKNNLLGGWCCTIPIIMAGCWCCTWTCNKASVSVKYL